MKNKKKKILISLIVSIFLLGIYLVTVTICTRRYLKEPKVKTEISNDDSKYLEQEIFGFDFPEGVKINKARLTYGRDGGVCIQFKNIKNYDNYISEKVKSKLTDINSYSETNVNIDGDTVDITQIVGYIDGSRKTIRIYKEGEFYSMELFTRYIKEEVFDIFK
ncbi:MAG: hypothetical protein GX275_05050 [Clostridiales bacterium]|nr:hypothetical protein [Clostridiales bacterium]